MSNSMRNYPDIIIYDANQAEKMIRALKIAKNGGHVDISGTGYIFDNYNSERDTIEVCGIARVSYSELMEFAQSKKNG